MSKSVEEQIKNMSIAPALYPSKEQITKVWNIVIKHLHNKNGTVVVSSYFPRYVSIIVKEFGKELKLVFWQDRFEMRMRLFQWVDTFQVFEYDENKLNERLKYPLKLFNIENEWEEYGN